MRSSLISKRNLLVLLAAVLIPALQAVAGGSHVTEGSKAAGLESCVAPTEVMRRNHMDFLKHGRDETVRDGVRGLDYSLSECIDCHAGTDKTGKAIPVDAEGQFCQSCHSYVAVSPACFQCHRTTPEPKKAGRYGYHEAETYAIPHEIQPAGIQRD